MNLQILKIFIFNLCALLALAGCGASAPSNINLSDEEIRSTAEALAWISVTQTAIANEMIPLTTPIAIEMIPSATPIGTVTPVPEPIVLSGVGSSDVEFYWSGPGIAHMNHIGAGNFVVESFDINNVALRVLVNKIGNYDGILPINFSNNEQAARFKVTADGAWAIALAPLTDARTFPLPAVISGTGDEVVMITGIPNTITVDTSGGSGRFTVSALTDFGVELVFNEVAPYTQTALLNGYTKMLIVSAESSWTLAIHPSQ